MKQLWHELCLQAYFQRFQLWALLAVLALWTVVTHWVIPRIVVDVIVYFSFGWLVLGKIFVPWAEHKLKQLFD
jgi:hypothetical protein